MQSGLARSLQTVASCQLVLVCVCVNCCYRGPGAVLGDDAVRDRRLAVGVVAAEDGAVTLRVSPQKFLASLDPLTLRLFSMLRQQQDNALQVGRRGGSQVQRLHQQQQAAAAATKRYPSSRSLRRPAAAAVLSAGPRVCAALQEAITAAAAAATAALGKGGQQQQQKQHPADAQRLSLLQEVFAAGIPSTLARAGQGPAADLPQQQQHRPAWQSTKAAGGSPGGGGRAQEDTSPSSSPPTARAEHQQQQCRSSQGPQLAARRSGGKGGGGRHAGVGGLTADAVWEAQLPAGLKADQCVGLPQTPSVKQLVEVRRFRFPNSRLPVISGFAWVC